MQIELDPRPAGEAGAPLVAIGVLSSDAGPVPAGDPGDLGIDLGAALDAVDHRGDLGSTARVPVPGGSLLAVGLGEEATAAGARQLGHAAGSTAADLDAVAVVLPDADPATSRAVAEGVVLGAYRFHAYQQDTQPATLDAVTLHGDGDAEAVRRGLVAARAATLCRDLVNTPPNDKRPPALAARAAELAEAAGLGVTVLDGDALEAGGYGGLMAVGKGSQEPPHLVELVHDPGDAATGGHVGLVGKGITFDTGGISLKPSSSMETMKMDMGGAAAVLATMVAVAELDLPVRVTAVLCLAENMPSGTAQRVSDVFTGLDGTTVEVMNTDAEGRLVMSDGITHVARAGATTIVDVATLTGAAVVALGEQLTLLMADDDDLADQLLAAGEAADELLWRMPVATEQYREKLDSTVADLKNVGGRAAGSITAGLFLHHFVPDGVAWGHLDIAGTAWSDGGGGIHSKGGTGVPVRALLRWLESR